jgi:uncharacterized protein YjiS (DUF1127 family)
MSPQQTTLTSDTGRDAPELGHNVSVALVKHTLDDVSAAARPNAAMAPLDDAWPAKDVAGPPAPSTRNVLNLLKRVWRMFQQRRQRRRSHASLHDLSERQLKDIGVTNAEIDYIVARRDLDRLRDGTATLWIRSRGVM